ncbi:MAG: methyltransferase domain-containing protein [Kiritimatiellae bacterium]|nr:methyltransferase domain-containing protein [Kiritimatiellia bacterium]
MSTLFDQYGENYDAAMTKSIGFMGQSHDYYTQAKAVHILSILRRHLGAPRQLAVLDVGSGVGKTDRFLSGGIGHLTGVDISATSVERARRENPSVRYEVYDGRQLPFPAESFAAACVICVMHHVAIPDRVALLQEVRRTLIPGGLLMIFEHNPLNPLTRLAVARCEFDRDAQLLTRGLSARLLKQAGFTIAEKRFILVSPFAFKGSGCLERAFCQAPLGAQYYVVGQKTG